MYSMSQSERMYVSQQSRLEYVASSSNSYQNSIGQLHYSIGNVPEQKYALINLLEQKSSYGIVFRTLSPQVYREPSYEEKAIYHLSPLFVPQGYNTEKEYPLHQIIVPEYHFIPENFIRPGKEGAFIGDAEQIKPFVEETFQRMFNLPFPNHINVRILNKNEFKKIAPHPGTIGLSLNRTKHGGISEIFVLEDSLARVMLTLGHELGHVLTETLSDQHDEEAKAYAFSLAWMKIVKEHNIANLGEAIVLENPAHNGLHNVSFAFVQKILDSGRDAWRLYLDLIHKNEHVRSDSLLLSSLCA